MRPAATPASGLGKATFAVDVPEVAWSRSLISDSKSCTNTATVHLQADVFALRIAQPSRSTALSANVELVVKEADGAEKSVIWDQVRCQSLGKPCL